jgi:glycosyltransferase involved in cell wall biosynthesis
MTASANTISVVIPCFNGDRFIGEAIESVLAQSHSDIDLIVVDDGSTDTSRSVVEGFFDDGRVRLIRHSENRGIAVARNTGIAESTSDYVAFLDQDDTWLPDKLEKQFAVLAADNDNGIGIVYTDRSITFLDGSIKKSTDSLIPAGINEASQEETIEALYVASFVLLSSVLVRKQCIDELGSLDESIRSGADDYEFCIRVAEHYRLFCIAEPLVIRREHARNFTDAAKLSPDTIAITRRLLEKHPFLASLQARRESRLYFLQARALHLMGQRGAARTAYHNAVRWRRGHLKARLGLVLCAMGPVGDVLQSAFTGMKKRRR